MEVTVLGEDFCVGQEVNFCATLFCLTRHTHGGHFHTIDDFNQTVLHKAFGKFQGMNFAFATHDQAQRFGQGIHARHTHTVQTTRYLVAVLVELATCVQFGQGNFSRTALGLVLVIHLHTRRNATTIVSDADGVVTVDGDHNVIAMACQSFVNRVVHHLEHQVVQACSVGGISNVHAGAFSNRFESFQNLDRSFTIAFAGD